MASRAEHLSPRETEIVRLVAHGFSNRAIASALAISHWTVSAHLRRVFAKLHVCTRAQAAALAAWEGFVPR